MLGWMAPPGFAPTGRRAQLDGVDLLELREGLVCAYNGFFDARGVGQQIGILPASGSGSERVAVALQRLTLRATGPRSRPASSSTPPRHPSRPPHPPPPLPPATPPAP